MGDARTLRASAGKTSPAPPPATVGLRASTFWFLVWIPQSAWVLPCGEYLLLGRLRRLSAKYKGGPMCFGVGSVLARRQQERRISETYRTWPFHKLLILVFAYCSPYGGCDRRDHRRPKDSTRQRSPRMRRVRCRFCLWGSEVFSDLKAQKPAFATLALANLKKKK